MDNTLYILGNGFDLSHGMKTEFDDFSNWGFENHFNLFKKISLMMKDTNELIIKEEDKVKWSDFENSLHRILQGPWFENFVEEASQTYVIDYADPDFNEGDHGNFLYEVSTQITSMSELKSLFKEWIFTQVEPHIMEYDPRYSFKQSDVFFTFNYTTVLEDLYSIRSEKVYHIHGNFNNVIVGHNSKYTDFISGEHDPMDQDVRITEVADIVGNLHAELAKNVPLQIDIFKHSGFYHQLLNTKEIKVMGHSYGLNDFDYFREISKKVNDNCIWRFFYKTEDDKKRLDNFLRYMPPVKHEKINSSEFNK